MFFAIVMSVGTRGNVFRAVSLVSRGKLIVRVLVSNGDGTNGLTTWVKGLFFLREHSIVNGKGVPSIFIIIEASLCFP